MGKNFLSMNDQEIDNICSGMNAASSATNNASDLTSQGFTGINHSGLFKGGLGKLNKRIQNLSSSIQNVQNTIRKHSDNMFITEKKYSTEAEGIDIPQDFVKNDARQVNSLSDIYLSKNDGNAVKTDAVSALSDNVDYDVNKQNMENINNNNKQDEMVYDAESKVKNKNLENIEKDETKSVDYKDEFSENNERLDAVKTNANTDLSGANVEFNNSNFANASYDTSVSTGYVSDSSNKKEEENKEKEEQEEKEKEKEEEDR